MSRETIYRYVCDRCGREAIGEHGFLHTLRYRHPLSIDDRGRDDWTIDLCEPCFEAVKEFAQHDAMAGEAKVE